MSTKSDVRAQYLGSGDPALKNYYPAWLDNMADDATVEGSMLDGVVQGADAVRSVVRTIRSCYERQEFKFTGACDNNSFLEDFVGEVQGEPLGCVVLVTRNGRPGRPSTPWRVTGHAARCCSLPACWPRGSPALQLGSTSPLASPAGDRNREVAMRGVKAGAVQLSPVRLVSPIPTSNGSSSALGVR
jgi:hypothetical protein